MNIKCALLAFSLMLSVIVKAKEDTFLVSTVQHPEASDFTDLIRNSYADIGIEVSFVEMPTERRLMSLFEGLTDADLVARGDVNNAYPTIIPIKPAIATIRVSLWCNKSVACSRAALFDSGRKIHTTISTINHINEMFDEPVRAEIITIENFGQIKAMFQAGKIESIVYVSSRPSPFEEKTASFSEVRLFEFELFHVISREHEHLKTELSRAISARLNNAYQGTR